MTDHRQPAAPPSASLHTRKRFALTGRSYSFDPRVDAARGDLADVRLADRVFAPHYAAAVQRSAATRTPVVATLGGEQVSELLAGETFDVLELSQGHAWGVGGVDGAVGFVAVAALAPAYPVTHIVCSAAADRPVGSRLGAEQASDLPVESLRPLDALAKDFVAVAEGLIGVPAVAGGRSSEGVDAAGLVSLSLSMVGLRAPRFADLQAAQLGHAVAAEAPMLRGDLLFRDGDVAIALDDTQVIAVTDAVARVPLAKWVGDDGVAIIRRRLP